MATETDGQRPQNKVCQLSDEDSDGEELSRLTINEHYAKAYAYKKEREELGRLKEKYGSDAELDEDEDSDDQETEDEDGDELTPGVDAAILRLLAKIKRKDPDIYDKDRPVFDVEKERSGHLTLLSTARKDKSKPVTLRQHKLAAELESTSRSPSPGPHTHVQEQHQLQHETIVAFHHAVADDDDDELLIPREKGKDELEREEEEYQEFLKREVGDDLEGLIEVEKDPIGILEDTNVYRPNVHGKEAKKRKTGKRKDISDQDFLMNYILNRGWIDRDARKLPTYAEVTSVKRNAKEAINELPKGDVGDDIQPDNEIVDDLDAEDEFDDVADTFESSYNFRFEEPDAATIPRFPRNITTTVRRQDTARKEARERRKERKDEELLKKKEEVNRMKALKMKELKAKLERIGREGGWEDIQDNEAFQELDLDGDWNPDAHDKQMSNIYQMEDEQDDVKPSWDDDIAIDDIIPPQNEGKKKKKKKKGSIITTNEEEEEWDGTEEMRKKKKEEYMDEIYGMDFNDIVGGIPTRFRYATLAPQSYGLSAQEILMADDKDLNQYIGIKKYAPYRKDRSWDSKRPERLKDLKQRLNEKKITNDNVEKPTKKRKGKKEREKLKASTAVEEMRTADKIEAEQVEPQQDKKGKRKHEVEENDEAAVNPTKKRKRRHKKTNSTE